MSCCAVLVQDQYGNYVVQHALHYSHLHRDVTVRARLVARVSAKITHFSQHKFASNVVECCLRYSTPSEKRALVAAICSPDTEGYVMLSLTH